MQLPVGRKLPDDIWWHRHRGVLILLWVHAVAIPVYGLTQHFGLRHIGFESLIVPTSALFAGLGQLDRRTRTVIASFGLLSCSAILVHLSHGLIEMHFHFFVMVAVVALYQDWVPFLTAIAYVFFHHGILGWVDGSSVFNHPNAQEHPWRWAGIHALFITGTSIACLVTWSLNEQILEANETLLGSERDARVSAETAGERLNLLADATNALTVSMELEPRMRRLVDLLASTVADVCVVDLVTEGGQLIRFASAGPVQVDRARSLEAGPPAPGDDMHPVVRCLRSKVPLIMSPAPAALLGPLAAERETVARSSALVVPILERSEAHGVLTVISLSDHRRLGDSELPLMAELGRRAGIAVANARLYARQRTVAETLQHSLLPERLPEVPGIESAARYIAGGTGVDVGGDWYDLVQLPGGRLLLTMGDVVGKGERAAALMGQVRNAVRAFAMTNPAPGYIVGSLNRLLHDLERSDMATMVCAMLDPESGRLCVCNAGHPPPALLAPDGSVRFLDQVSGPPIGAVPRSLYDEFEAILEPGTTVLLYTDGLVEDRTMPLGEGLDRLSAALTDAPERLESLTDRVLTRGLADRDASDDVAVLAVRLIPLGTSLNLRLPTTISTLEPLRATLRRWLVDAGAAEEETYEVLVAICEACANAIVHARGPAATTFDLDARLGDDIQVEVRDHGTWRPPRPTSGGRGLLIMESFMDDVDVRTTPEGTHVSMRRRLGRRSLVDAS